VLPAIGSAGLDVEQLAQRLAAEVPGLQGVRIQEPDTVLADVDRAALHDVARAVHDLPGIAFEQLNFVAGVDHVSHLESVYHLYSFAANLYLELHVEVPRAKPEVDTVSDVWPSADWHEREAWDMLGIVYLNHPDLRRILLKDDWVGHPLRKDYVDVVENHPYV
jgi:NADH-quinone oxidoreductase subunit C